LTIFSIPPFKILKSCFAVVVVVVVVVVVNVVEFNGLDACKADFNILVRNAYICGNMINLLFSHIDDAPTIPILCLSNKYLNSFNHFPSL